MSSHSKKPRAPRASNLRVYQFIPSSTVTTMGSCRDLPYMLELDTLKKHLKSVKEPSRVVVQLPPGIKQYSDKIIECIRVLLSNAEIYVHGDPSFGACDTSYPEFTTILGADLIVHVGHTPYPPWLSPTSLPPEEKRIVFVPLRSKLPLDTMAGDLASVLEKRGYHSIVLTATVQHTHLLRELAKALESGYGIRAVIPEGRPPYFEPGQVLGCDYTLARRAGSAEAYVFVGGGLFHPLGLFLSTLKPVIQADPYQGRVRDITPIGEKTLKVRLYKVASAFNARNWAVILGLKTGQYRPGLVRALKERIEARGRHAILVAYERLTLEDLRSLPQSIEAVAVTSCPRLPIDDLSSYEKPVLTPGEAFMALEEKLEPYRFPW